MATLLDIRRKIRSIINIQQMTKAMKTVSTVKLKRAQQALLDNRAYAHRLPVLVSSIVTRVDRSLHPLLEKREEKKIELIIITSDRGLCGAFNSKIRDKAIEFIEDKREKAEIYLTLIGKKAITYFKKENFKVHFELPGIFQDLKYEKIKEIAQSLIDLFLKKEIDAIYVIYNEFRSILRHELTVRKLIPFEEIEEEKEKAQTDYIYEPDAKTILEKLLPSYVENQLYHFLTESITSEHSARMIAMENATNNAQELIDELILIRNKVRQAMITKELVNIMTTIRALEGR
ncbi:ATP synthase F1 subunit gamma [Candidatus Aminicenantes bacterium AC-335-A11]|jgi:F-type H+-transporting ATPase subunit gamma|nr:ATP synthase F1 subunit gamma [SCandidatus Aminicenantes bacterium Aminicenantia_JdfR_composite]MCP2596423.1 ATP synthase F1 subunit gamma [Candidatus Aminicenantes bacterium AC-335-G13]MCP2606182.1 ATP synthase F1 subunit gamma [Candidatus Aminicenantes bacterium AC-708-I09]MCP2618199.1 ATP synthase F1 subunit gamma [Candidatus Aminicenantes bacterium AC-335-A11]MCP2621002.1 ATP synthase F1 subunit gamma [Candidatus Aminicenantes bacterium AC-334-E05]